MTKFVAACVQMRSGLDPAVNLEAALQRVREAAKLGATYVQTPEMTTLMALQREHLLEKTLAEESDPAIPAFKSLARELGIWLHIGSLPIKISDDQVANRAFVFSAEGETVATYDKIHMFDVDLPGGESYRESHTYRPGGRAVAVDLPWARLGLSICYDVRFAYLYRSLAQSGAKILAVPAAFTEKTGKAHWHLLLRTRAIETGCYVIAAAQGGMHENGRATYGHSLIVAPWGEIIGEVEGDDPGVVIAEIDLAAVDEARTRVPALRHDRTYQLVAPE